MTSASEQERNGGEEAITSQVNAAIDTNSKGGPIADFAFDEALIEWTVTKAEWLRIHGKHFNGVATAAFVFDAQNRVLLVQRAAHDSMPNLWEVPGGAVDAGDISILHGCVRELMEEAGLVARRIKRLVTEGVGQGREGWSVFTNSTGTLAICAFGFEVEVEEGGEVVLDPNEHQDWVWAGEEEIGRGVTDGGKKIPLSGVRMRNKLTEAFRLRREDGGNVDESV
ncbi:NUDIX domain-containing protein [Trichoderma ceciliae]